MAVCLRGAWRRRPATKAAGTRSGGRGRGARGGQTAAARPRGRASDATPRGKRHRRRRARPTVAGNPASQRGPATRGAMGGHNFRGPKRSARTLCAGSARRPPGSRLQRRRRAGNGDWGPAVELEAMLHIATARPARPGGGVAPPRGGPARRATAARAAPPRRARYLGAPPGDLGKPAVAAGAELEASERRGRSTKRTSSSSQALLRGELPSLAARRSPARPLSAAQIFKRTPTIENYNFLHFLLYPKHNFWNLKVQYH